MTESVFLTQLETLQKPQLEPLTLDEVTDWIHASSTEETQIRRLLVMCRGMLEKRLGIAFYTQQLRATFEFSLPGSELIPLAWSYENMVCTVPRPPLQSFDVVEVESDIDVFKAVGAETYDTIRQFPAQVYFYGNAFGMVEYPWWINLNREPRVRVTYTCGYPNIDDIPDDYKLILLQLIADTYLRREGGALSPELGSTILANKLLAL